MSVDHRPPLRRATACRLVAASSIALVLLCSGCLDSPSVRRDAPVAAVLLPTTSGAELVLVDLERFEVASRVPLRSLALSLDGDARSRVVVTAQCGGIGASADTAAGVCDLDRGNGIAYLDLAVPNPSFVAVANGRALVVHGFEQPQGLVASRIDLTPRRLLPGMHVPPTAGRPERVGDRIFLPLNAGAGPAGDGDAAAMSELAVLDRDGVSTVATLPVGTFTVLASDATESQALCVGRSQSASGPDEWRIFGVDPQSGEVLAQGVVPGIEKGVFEGCRWNDAVALADADGLDLDDPGNRILVLDASTLAVRRVIEIDGMPAALEPWGRSLLVADGVGGRLLRFDPGEPSPARVLELGGSPGGVADLSVFAEPAPSWR